MADVRSMLRAERESRRITHPHASYTSSGNLLCNICEVPVKSERAWSAHLHTTQHSLRLARERDANQARKEAAPASKKRKAVEFEEPEDTDRKKAKPASTNGSVIGPEDEAETIVEVTAPPVEQNEIDDAAAAAELEALQRDLDALEQENTHNQSNTLAVLSAAATISAPAISAHELAAQAREEQSNQRTRRDEEMENEKEDAVRALEDEFEEMDGLQERLRILRERREALRKQPEAITNTTQPEGADSLGIPDRTVNTLEGKSIEDGDSEDSDEEDDDWAFGAR